MANKPVTYSERDVAIVNALKNAPEGLTLAQLSEATGMEIKPGHITGAKRKGLIESIGEVEVIKEGKRKVSTYNFVTADVLNKEDGKPHNYTDNEKAVLTVAAGIDSPFTLADLATAMGLDKLSSGRINGLVGKGNISKGEMVEVPCSTKSSVKVYGFVADIPAGE